MSKKTFKEPGWIFKPTSIIIAKKIANQYDGIYRSFSTSELVVGGDSLTEAMVLMVDILIIEVAVLSVVVLYNLGLLSFTEMGRDMATLKVICIWHHFWTFDFC